MKDVEKYERFEDLKKSENSEVHNSDTSQVLAKEFIKLLRENSKKIETQSKQ